MALPRFGFMTLLAFIALLAGVGAHAQSPRPGGNAIHVALVAETQRPAAGTTVALALDMRPRPGWHGYWENPGDAGRGMAMDWRLPAGLEAGAPRYPVPERLTIAGLMNYVYKAPYAPLIELKVPGGLAPGTRLPLRASLDYLACTDEICVPESAEVALDLVVGDGRVDPGARARFDRWRQALPRPLGIDGRFERVGEQVRIGVPLPAGMTLSDPYFYPLSEAAIDYGAPQRVTRNGDWLVIEAIGRGQVEAIEGVLAIGGDDGLRMTLRPGDVPAAGQPLSTGGFGTAILLALLGAFAGGLILNVMPCVFPILSLKALSLARAGGSETAARREGLAYGGGVVLVCLALGGAMLALRAAGGSAGWAFQLQDPRVILLLLLLVTAIALNLFGLFRLPALATGDRLAGQGGTGGAFWTGALAAFIATPCTGPFMGAALGAALVLPPAAALAVFGGLGLGLAFPFLLLAFVPALRRRLPRPGPWMARFQRLLAIPMLLTAAGLLWILERQAGSGGLALGLAAAAMLGLGLWLLGRRQGRPRAWFPLAPAALAGIAAILLVPVGVSAPARAEGMLRSQPFSEERLAALRSEGRPVFLYFTADWCLTCKVNEAGVLERDEVARAFADNQVAVLVGDWTLADAEIGRFLARHGRSGIPFYLFYPPGGAPQTLPQVLTTARLIDAARAGPARPAAAAE